MRRQEKNILTGAAIVGCLAVLIDLWLQYLDLKRKEQKLDWQNYDKGRAVGCLLGGAAVGGGLGYLRYRMQVSDEKEKPFNSKQFLNDVLSQHDLKQSPDLLDLAQQIKTEVLDFINAEFRDKLAGPAEVTGSFFRRTYISKGFDIDIIIPLRKYSYLTIDGMYHDVCRRMSQGFKGRDAVVRAHKKGISLVVSAEGQTIEFDIVPGRERGCYAVDQDLTLAVQPNWFWETATHMKTNVTVHKTLTTNNAPARKVIKLLKVLREKGDFYLPSILLEQLVVESFDRGYSSPAYSDADNLSKCMHYISRRILASSIPDASNSNNDLGSRLSGGQRSTVAEQFAWDSKKVQEDKRFLKEMFS